VVTVYELAVALGVRRRASSVRCIAAVPSARGGDFGNTGRGSSSEIREGTAPVRGLLLLNQELPILSPLLDRGPVLYPCRSHRTAGRTLPICRSQAR
jgi:hypothetical protein